MKQKKLLVILSISSLILICGWFGLSYYLDNDQKQNIQNDEVQYVQSNAVDSEIKDLDDNSEVETASEVISEIDVVSDTTSNV